jgi:hypothetical protein
VEIVMRTFAAVPSRTGKSQRLRVGWAHRDVEIEDLVRVLEIATILALPGSGHPD